MNLKLGRLFTFGCSFTQYNWPTWADILGREFDFSENWGRAGSGNQFIFNSLIECSQKNKFTSQDHVIIMWTSVDREDRYVANRGGWIGKGGVFHHTLYAESWVNKFACHRGYLIRDLAAITAAKTLLEHWGVNYTMLSMMPLAQSEHWPQIDDTNSDVINLYKSAVDEIKTSICELIFNEDFSRKLTFSNTRKPTKELVNTLKQTYIKCAGDDWPSFDHFYKQLPIEESIAEEIKKFFLFDRLQDIVLGQDTSHPSPQEHLYYLQRVLPEYEISNDTIEWIEQYQFSDYFNKHLPNRL